jgi:hypothetical protein
VKIVVKGRQEGKTTEAVEWTLQAPNRILVTFSEAEKRRLCKKYPALERYQQTISIEDLRSGYLFGRVNYRNNERYELAIDNLEHMLHIFLGNNNRVGLVTLNKDTDEGNDAY